MLHNHHSKSKGLKQLVLMFTTNHTFMRDRHELNDAHDTEKKRQANITASLLPISNRSFNLLSYE